MLIAFAVVMALPRDESIIGEIADDEQIYPEILQKIFKLKKFKKLFLG